MSVQVFRFKQDGGRDSYEVDRPAQFARFLGCSHIRTTARMFIVRVRYELSDQVRLFASIESDERVGLFDVVLYGRGSVFEDFLLTGLGYYQGQLRLFESVVVLFSSIRGNL